LSTGVIVRSTCSSGSRSETSITIPSTAAKTGTPIRFSWNERMIESSPVWPSYVCVPQLQSSVPGPGRGRRSSTK
jgi:hypothetical protein